MIREYVVNGDKLITEYITDGESYKNVDNSCFALLRAKGLVDKGKKVLMIDKEKTPGIAIFALLDVIKADNIEREKPTEARMGSMSSGLQTMAHIIWMIIIVSSPWKRHWYEKATYNIFILKLLPPILNANKPW